MAKSLFERQHEEYEKLRKSTQSLVRIDYSEVCKIVVRELINMRNNGTTKPEKIDALDVVLRCYLEEDEFQKYVIQKQTID